MIGGTSWHSTKEYYQYINEIVGKRLGGNNSAKIILSSVNMQDILDNIARDDWAAVKQQIITEVRRLESAGADFWMLCANAMHLFADEAEQSVNIPCLHIVDVVRAKIQELKINNVLLLGVRFTMDNDFYPKRLLPYGIATRLPDEADRDYIHKNIYDELTLGIIKDETRVRYLEIINNLYPA